MKAIVSATIRLRHPEHFVVGEDSIVDDFCYFSTKMCIGRGSHIAASCTIGGGVQWQFTMGDFSSLSAGVTVWCASNDYVRDLVMPVPNGIGAIEHHAIVGDVTLGNYTGVGANTVIMPDNQIPEGTVVGALSFVPPRFSFERWAVYAGNPLRLIRMRDRESVLAQVRAVEEGLRRRDRP